MRNLIIRLVINAVALWVAAYFVSGFEIASLGNLLIIALVFGVVNALIKPIVKLVTCPINVLTLGLFTFVVNALMLMLTSWIVGRWSLMEVPTFVEALLASIIVSIVSVVLSMFLDDD